MCEVKSCIYFDCFLDVVWAGVNTFCDCHSQAELYKDYQEHIFINDVSALRPDVHHTVYRSVNVQKIA